MLNISDEEIGACSHGVTRLNWNICATSSFVSNRVFTQSSKRPANFQQMYSKYTC